MNHLRLAIRSLAKSPGFTAVAALTLALGLGATTAFFSVLYGVVLREPPYPNAGQLYHVYNRSESGAANGGRLSLAEYLDYRTRQKSLAGLGVSVSGRTTLNSDQSAERVLITRISANLLPLLGVLPTQGRNFTEDEQHAGRNNVVLVSHDFWQSQLGGAADILTRTVRLNGVEHSIIGIMPPGFAYGEEPDTSFWKPLELDSRGAADRGDHWLKALGRLAPGVSLVQAQSDLQAVARQLQADLPNEYPTDARWSIGLQSLRENKFGSMTAPLAALLAAAGAVLLIACVNVSIMFLLRGATRRREIMIRLALGAARRHIVGQLLAESAVICGLGMLGGLALASFGLDALKAFSPGEIPRLQEVALNGPVALFTAAILLVVTLFVGIAPATSVLKTKINEGITQTGRTTESRGTVRLRDSLTVVEIALAVLLLVTAGLTLRSLQGLLRVNLGFTTSQLLTFKTNLTESAYPDATRANGFYERLNAKIEALPGVMSVGAVSHLPLSGESQTVSATLAAASAPGGGTPSGHATGWRIVRGAYFESMGLSLLRGRNFSGADQPESLPVAIIDQELARRFWSDPAAAIGQQLRFSGSGGTEIRTVVGVVGHVKHFGPGQPSVPDAYLPHTQFYQRGMFTVVKMAGAAEPLAPLVRAAIGEVDPLVPMYFTETMEGRYDHAIALPRFTAGLISAFSTLALVLAGVGIFGVTAYSVNQRSREFGIRFSLGAQRSHVAGLVLGRVGRLTLMGSAVGALAAFWVAELMTSILFGVEPMDPPTLALATAVIALTAVLASLGPLTRALRVNPVEALRAE